MYKKILLAYDGSETGQDALLQSREMAEWAKAEIALVAVMPPPAYYAPAPAYEPAPVYYEPAPVYYGPSVVFETGHYGHRFYGHPHREWHGHRWH